MRVGVSGATGFIGRHLCARLRARGDEVSQLVRSREKVRGKIAWDAGNGFLDLRSLEGIDAVVHLGGESIAARRWSTQQRREILDSRVSGTTFLSEQLTHLESPPDVLVSASAIGYYGDRGTEVLDESSVRGRGFLPDVCEAWEAATSEAGAAGIRVACIRTGLVLGRDGGVFAKQLPLFKLGLAGTLGSGTQFMSWISIDDEVDAIIRIVDDRRIQGPVNLTSTTPVTNKVFTRTVANALRRPAFMRIPKRVLEIGLGTDMATELLMASQFVVPKVLQDAGFNFHHETLDDALADLL
ncbi:MAG: TIGR01777 family oxidoreductase [Acidimicrobiales bacterium]